MITRTLLLGAAALAPLAVASRPAAAPPATVADSLPSPTGPGAAEPNLAVGPDGSVYLSWLEPADSGHALKVARFDGTAWSPARTIRSGRDFFVNWADFPSVAVTRDGRLTAHWLQRTGSSTYAYGVRVAQSRDGGASWSAPVRPHSDSSNTEHGFVALWPEASGNGVGAAWLDGRKFAKEGHSPSNEMTVMTATLGTDGRVGAEALLDARACDCCQTAAAVTSKGPIVAYRDRSSDEIRDIAVVRRVNGKWTRPAVPNPDNWKIAACPVNGPSLSASGERVALAWFTAAGDTARVKLAFSSDAGATFTPPVRIDEGAPAGRVDVELLRDGGALVTWIERMADTAAVRLRRVDAKGKAGAPVTIGASSAARASGFPRMAVSGEHVFFAWTMPGRPSSVRISRMKAADIR